jgi:2-hydroxy-3-keto-5-methylthiopentenyl-1-phosphate phosphatase
METSINISVGELLDKLTILEIKKEKIKSEEKLIHIEKEYGILKEKSSQYLDSLEVKEVFEELIEVNSKLWVIEDDLRDLESQKRFDEEFVEKARLVYMTNDHRFALKNKINLLTNSGIQEQKGYKSY